MTIAGDSVGGNMAAVIALLAKERNGPSFKAQVLFYPVTDASLSTTSYEHSRTVRGSQKAAMAWFWDQYIPEPSQRAEVHASPINALKQELTGLPQTLLIVHENDVLRDDGEDYGRKLAEAGVRERDDAVAGCLDIRRDLLNKRRDRSVPAHNSHGGGRE
jgi:acetyl esterase